MTTTKKKSMTKKTESIILENKDGQRLRIYRVENTEGKDLTFCIGLEGEGQDHFTFYQEDAVDITSAIDTGVDSFAAQGERHERQRQGENTRRAGGSNDHNTYDHLPAAD